MPEPDDLWTVTQAAQHFGVAPDTIRSWVFRGHLPVARDHDGDEYRNPVRFNPVDVAEAEYRTRLRARRTIAA